MPCYKATYLPYQPSSSFLVPINTLVYGYIPDITYIMYYLLAYSSYGLHVQPTNCYLELKQQSMITVIGGMERKSYKLPNRELHFNIIPRQHINRPWLIAYTNRTSSNSHNDDTINPQKYLYSEFILFIWISVSLVFICIMKPRILVHDGQHM